MPSPPGVAFFNLNGTLLGLSPREALAGTAYVEGPTPEWLSPFAKFVGFAVRFQSIERGVLDVRDMFYFVSVIVLFVYLNITVVEARRLK